jgi:hypothetical protein
VRDPFGEVLVAPGRIYEELSDTGYDGISVPSGVDGRDKPEEGEDIEREDKEDAASLLSRAGTRKGVVMLSETVTTFIPIPSKLEPGMNSVVDPSLCFICILGG